MARLRFRLAALIGLLALPLPAAEPGPVLSDCRRPFVFGFGSWDKAKTFPVGPDGIRVVAPNGQGGAGVAGITVNLGAYADWTPVLTLTAGEGHKLAVLNLHLGDDDGTRHTYRFDLRGLQPGVAQQVLAEQGASLSEPQEVEKPGDTPGLGPVTVYMLIGDWSRQPVDLTLGRIGLVPPTDELRAGRAKLAQERARAAERARQKAEAERKAREDLLAKGASHPADGPTVTHVCATALDVLTFTLQAGRHANNELRPYEAQPGDEFAEEGKDKPRHTVRDGKVVDYPTTVVYRRVGNKRTRLGLLSPDRKLLFVERETTGLVLDETLVDWPQAWRVESADDPGYAQPVTPTAVFRKGKPNGFSKPLPFLYTVSLRLPAPLKVGARYTLRCHGVNTAQETVTYTHQPREARSLAIHAIQTGYRPDDPYKRAYLSFWMGVDKDGKHGSCTPAATSFELLDAAGRTAFTGQAVLAKADGAAERMSIHEQQDYTKAAVYRLDFSRFDQPGEYRVHVPGIGVSGPFRVAVDVWQAPFRAAMQGILAQRQGIDLGPPYCSFTRRRAHHPDDGVQFYQLDIPQQAGQEGVRGKRLIELAQAGPLPRTTIVAGGYQDAGDWDTIGHHLSATYDLLGLYDLNPAAFKATKLNLPPAEAANNLPDLLDEALWQMPLWRSLQLPDGGVRGGYGDGWGCYPGETSSMFRYAAVYAPDHDTTLRYAAAAARTARVLTALGVTGAGAWLESARRAWAWAEAHGQPDDPIYQQVAAHDKNLAKELRRRRATAAVELLAATRDPAYDQAFQAATDLTATNTVYIDELGPAFAYARLPAGVGDAALKQRAVERLTKLADHAIAFSRHNAYDVIAGTRTDFPLIFACKYFSTPAQGGLALVYAYELTRRPEYLAAAVQGSNYCLGANPDNLSYCTGVGWNAQHYPFLVDAQITGQYPDVPVGHIPFGQGNEGNAMSRGANGWVQQWLLNFGPAKKMTPNWYDWPVNEQYIDFGRYPLHNENCFNATSVPAACYWFWLATRGSGDR